MNNKDYLRFVIGFIACIGVTIGVFVTNLGWIVGSAYTRGGPDVLFVVAFSVAVVLLLVLLVYCYKNPGDPDNPL